MVLLAAMDAVEEKLLGKKIDNQNAYVDEASFGGRIGEMSRVVSKRYALDYCMSKMARENHENNEIYIHDLDSYAVGMHNCLSIPFDDLLANGFNTRQTDVRPAQSISTAFQLVAVIFQIQSLQQFGGVSATHLDWTMVPYVRKSFSKHFKDGIKYIKPEDDPSRVPKELSFIFRYFFIFLNNRPKTTHLPTSSNSTNILPFFPLTHLPLGRRTARHGLRRKSGRVSRSPK